MTPEKRAHAQRMADHMARCAEKQEAIERLCAWLVSGKPGGFTDNLPRTHGLIQEQYEAAWHVKQGLR